MSILSEILAAKRTEVDCAKRRVPPAEMERRVAKMPPARDFAGALRAAPSPAVIAEVKKASPSKGVIREDFEPVALARSLAENGAACLSVLTDEPYFQGSLAYLASIRREVDIPILRKDFLIDEYHILESRAAGADAVLLIAAALKPEELEWLTEATSALGMATLIEVHDKEELELALQTRDALIGINNRDLHTFRTTLQTTLDLLPGIPEDRLVISESGINVRQDVERLGRAGVHAVLVGESLMRAPDPAAHLRDLLGQ